MAWDTWPVNGSEKLSDAIRRILADPEVGRLMNERGLEFMNTTPRLLCAWCRVAISSRLSWMPDVRFGLESTE